MKFFETSEYFSLKKSTYINLRLIGIIGQLITINLSYFAFDLKFDLISGNLIVLIGVLSNLYLIHINKNTQLFDKTSFIFLLIETPKDNAKIVSNKLKTKIESLFEANLKDKKIKITTYSKNLNEVLNSNVK